MLSHNVVRLRERMLAERLRGAGYTTVGASSNPWISANAGMNAGFDEFLRVRAKAQYEKRP